MYLEKMPRVVFCEELEGKLIELWAAEQKASNGTVQKRSVKEKEIAVKLNLFSRQLYGDKFQKEITVQIVHNRRPSEVVLELRSSKSPAVGKKEDPGCSSVSKSRVQSKKLDRLNDWRRYVANSNLFRLRFYITGGILHWNQQTGRHSYGQKDKASTNKFLSRWFLFQINVELSEIKFGI